MNKIIVSILLISSFQLSFAQETTEQIPVEHYHYGTQLDIAKVIKMETPPDECKVVTTHMLYLDSKGVKHNLEYNIMGNGCSNG